jgi:hypothetical protein
MLTAESHKGRLLHWEPWVMNERFLGRTSLFMGAQLGNLQWACLPGTLRDGSNGLWSWSITLYGRYVKGTWREGSLAGDLGG